MFPSFEGDSEKHRPFFFSTKLECLVYAKDKPFEDSQSITCPEETIVFLELSSWNISVSSELVCFCYCSQMLLINALQVRELKEWKNKSIL